MKLDKQTDEEIKKEEFSRKIRAGKRTYYIDVKTTKSFSDYYITITERHQISETENVKHKIFIYEEDLDKFLNALTETVTHVHDKTQNEVPQFDDEEKTEAPQILN
jgi:hypothetical protein